MPGLFNDDDLSGWDSLKDELNQPYMRELEALLLRRIADGRHFRPDPAEILKAFRLTKPGEVRVVILGQDPYHQPGVATGLAFALPHSFPKGVRRPPSLTKIYSAISQDDPSRPSGNDDLEHWATNGILLLNTVLTVDQGYAGSHRGLGWECFTNRAIHSVATHTKPAVFMLWGKDAQRKRVFIEGSGSPILESPHPTHKDFDAGENGHFSAAERHVGALPWTTRPPSRR